MISSDETPGVTQRNRKTKGDAVASQNLSYQELLQLVELIKSSSQFREFRFRSGDIELELRRGSPDSDSDCAAAAPRAADPLPMQRGVEPTGAVDSKGRAPRASSGAHPPPTAVQAIPEGATVIRSPMVGTFYRAPEPGATPFVEVGSSVDATNTVCIIEVMKLMNSIPAGCSGVVSRILAEDGDAVEYGQDLIVITPA